MDNRYPIRIPHVREEVVAETGLTLVCGVWLLFSPVALGYFSEPIAYSDVLSGIALGLIPLWHLLRHYRDTLALAVNVLIGVWLMVAPLVLEGPPNAAVNGVVIGFAVLVLALRVAYASHYPSAT